MIDPSRLKEESSPFTILLVCTGNICRSALAERLGQAFLAQALGDAAEQARIVSAGTQAVVDSPMHPDSALVLRGLGVEPGDFRARQLVDGMATAADLTLTMTRSHRKDVLQRDPRALARTFTLREAANLLERLGALQPDGATLADRARGVVARMAAARSGRQESADDDVPDPIGRPIEVHAEVGTLIVETLFPVLQRLVQLRAK